MLDDLENKIRNIQVFSNKIANELLAGEYHSVFKGHGLEFSELREYQYGDDPRIINWQITARVGRPFIKRYIEERELTLFFLVDMSASGNFGSHGKSKAAAIAEICSLLAFSAIKNSDKVALIIFTDSVEHIIPPGRGKKHVLRIISELLSFKPAGRRTNIERTLDYFGHLHAKRSIVFLVSDFQDSGFENSLSIISKQHDLIAVTIHDPAELTLPDMGLLALADPETGETALIDTSSEKVRRSFEDRAGIRKQSLSDMLTKNSIDEIEISTDSDIVAALIRFFKTREKRGRYG